MDHRTKCDTYTSNILSRDLVSWCLPSRFTILPKFAVNSVVLHLKFNSAYNSGNVANRASENTNLMLAVLIRYQLITTRIE